MTDPDTTLPLVTPDEIRAAVSGLSDPPYTDPILARFVARFEDLVVTYRGFSPMPRAATETVQIGRSGRLLLSRPLVTHLTALGYETGTAPDPEDVKIRNGYELAIDTAWPCGTWVTPAYIHGSSEKIPALVDGCIEFVRAEARQQRDSQPRNVTSVRDDMGWSYESTADISKGRPTKWLVVNDALNSVPDMRLPVIA